MPRTSISEAEAQLDQMFQMPLYAREATWFEVVDMLDEDASLESRKRPAPVTMRFDETRPIAT